MNDHRLTIAPTLSTTLIPFPVELTDDQAIHFCRLMQQRQSELSADYFVQVGVNGLIAQAADGISFYRLLKIVQDIYNETLNTEIISEDAWPTQKAASNRVH
mgnify:FL=1